jgi:hypothetical protein
VLARACARESFLPVQDAFLPVGRERRAGDFEPAMCRRKKAPAVEIVGAFLYQAAEWLTL